MVILISATKNVPDALQLWKEQIMERWKAMENTLIDKTPV